MPKKKFSDYFSDNAEGYSTYRPTYPEELFAHLADISSTQEWAWDCATGNGQAALRLSKYFDHVIATDGSEAQLDQAPIIENISYRVAEAEKSGLEKESVDLITVAQAVHWFDLTKFSHEVSRVLKPDGVLAVWTYNLLSCESAIDECINHFYDKTVGDYWPFERKQVENGYRDLTFPLTERSSPSFSMNASWTLPHLLGYLNTWSAVSAYTKEHGNNPIDQIVDELSSNWGDPNEPKQVIWPLSVKIWVKQTP